MRRTIRFILMAVASACTIGMSTISSGAILPVPVSATATSEHSAGFVVAGLFNSTVTDADVGVTVYGVSGDPQWAGLGAGPGGGSTARAEAVTVTGGADEGA